MQLGLRLKCGLSVKTLSIEIGVLDRADPLGLPSGAKSDLSFAFLISVSLSELVYGRVKLVVELVSARLSSATLWVVVPVLPPAVSKSSSGLRIL